MERKDLTDSERRALSLMVSKLFDGAVLQIPVADGVVKQLCFRMAGEKLPDQPLGESLKASENSLFISGEVFSGGKLLKRTWLGMGPLDEVLVTLKHLGGTKKILSQFLHESAVRKALGVDDSVPYELGRAGVSPKASPLKDELGDRADDEFEAYDFGEDCRVVGHDGWERVQSGGDGDVDFSKIVYARFADDESGADSTKLTFNVKFKGGQVDEVYALEHRHGNEIGQRRQPGSERPRG